MAKTDGVWDSPHALADRAGTILGESRPFTVGQFEENVFAALIGDWDPMHNDPSWQFSASWHETIVLGFHALSYAERYLREAGVEGSFATVGLGRVRFVAPLPVGHEAICSVRLDSVDEASGRLHTTLTVSRTDRRSPTMIAQHVASLEGRAASRDAESDAPLIADIPAGRPIRDEGVHDNAFYERVERRAGGWLGSTPWTPVDTRSANTFRVLVGEPVSANHPSRDAGGQMLVHPLHLLALRSYFMPQVGLAVLSDDFMAAFNYGLDGATWFDNVPAGSRIRDHVQLVSVRQKDPGRWLVKTRHVVEVEGRPRAALSADCLSLFAMLGHE